MGKRMGGFAIAVALLAPVDGEASVCLSRLQGEAGRGDAVDVIGLTWDRTVGLRCTRDDIVQPILFQVIGGITPVPLNIPEVLPNLNTGAIDIVIAPALAAEQLQWSSKLDTIVSDVAGVAIGALVISSKRLAALS